MPVSTAEVKDVLTIFFCLVKWKSIATIDLNKTIIGRVSNEEAAAIIEVLNIVNTSTYYDAALSYLILNYRWMIDPILTLL